MKKSAVFRLILCAGVIGMAANPWAADQKKPKTLEEKAWDEVDSLDRQSLEDFLKRFPDGELAAQAKLAKELQNGVYRIKEGKTENAFSISLDQLGDTWKDWQKRNPSKGTIGYFTKKGETRNTMGWFVPDPLGGGKTPGRDTFSFDWRGLMVSPTGEGSIIAFSTDGLEFHFMKDVVLQTPGTEPIFFAVLKGKGLVYVQGEGTVTLPDGTTTALKDVKVDMAPKPMDKEKSDNPTVVSSKETQELPFAIKQAEIQVAGGMTGKEFLGVCKKGHVFLIAVVMEAEKDVKISDRALKRTVIDSKGQRYQPIGFGFLSQGYPEAHPFVMQRGMFEGDIEIAEIKKSLMALFFIIPDDVKNISIEFEGKNEKVSIVEDWVPDDALKIPGLYLYGEMEFSFPSIEKDGWGMK